MNITSEQIYRAVPNADPELVQQIVDSWQIAIKNGVVDRKQTSFFLGHAATETQGFTRLEENLYYTTPERLVKVWPTRFKSVAAAKPYIRNPKALANLVYGSRMGNEKDGVNDDDGWEKRGSGLFQTTGEANFEVVQKVTGLPVVEQPELLRTMPHALEAAAIYWRVNKLGDLLSQPDAIAATTRRIQGGTGGLAERTIYINRFLSIFADAPNYATVYKRGARGDVVKAFQATLSKLGFYGGELDGMFGPGMENAVREFQDHFNIHPVDGVIGPMTRAEIEEKA